VINLPLNSGINNDFGGFAVKNALHLKELIKNLQPE